MSQSSGTAATGDNCGGKNMSACWLFSLGLISRIQHTDSHIFTNTHTHTHTHTHTLMQILYNKELSPSTSTASQQAQIEPVRQ